MIAATIPVTAAAAAAAFAAGALCVGALCLRIHRAARRREAAQAEQCSRLVAEAERARAEAERLAAALRQIPVAVVVRGVDGMLQVANAEAARLLGDIVPHSDESARIGFRFLTPDGTPLGLDELPLYRARRSGETVWNEGMLLERPDGTTVPVSVSAAPVRDAAGTLIAAAAVIVDLTHRHGAAGDAFPRALLKQP